MLTTLYFILALGFLILIHELGHYLAAKLVRIPIQEFGIGFPPRLVTLFRAGGTEFTLNMLPVGGFVRAKERPGDEEIPDELMAAAPWRRIVVLLAGSAVNLTAAVLMLSFAYFQIGKNIDHILIVGVDPESPAAAAGLMPEDQIVAVNGIEVTTAEELQALIDRNKGQETEFTYMRAGEYDTVTLTPRLEYDPLVEGPIGVGLFEPLTLFGAVRESVALLVFQVQQIANLPFRLVGLKGMLDGFTVAQDLDASTTSVTAGTNTVWFLASISFSLGLINLLPVPIFDGGKILLALPELFTGKRVPIRLYYVLNMVSLALVLALMVYVNVNDFINPSINLDALTPTP
jgi:regulator of sigma E protease